MDTAQYRQLYQYSLESPEAFWLEMSRLITWFTPPTRAFSGSWENPEWFGDGTLNLSYNCLDRHVEAGRGEHTALISINEEGQTRTLSYAQTLEKVERLARGLRRLGVQAGDRVALYFPQTAEHIIAMQACARIGAIHVVVFAGFSATALRLRLDTTQAKVLLTSTFTQRRGKKIPLLETVREAMINQTTVKNTIVWRRDELEVPLTTGEVDWDELLESQDPGEKAIPRRAEDPSFILHTSGTTGNPKGILHTTGGYAVYTALTAQHVLDIHPDDIYWCTADPGWITGHSYVAYAPLMLGATVVLAEGAPDFPQPDRWWSIVEKLKVTILYTAPTAIRLFRRYGEEYPAKHNLSSLRLLGTVGEPINPEAWEWYNHAIGHGRCPIIDTWWQTETGGHLLATLPGLKQKPGKAGSPFFGIQPAVVNKEGAELPTGETGHLVIRQPWPSSLRGCWQDSERFSQYWHTLPGNFWTGDLAVRDEEGYIQVLGRSDDVINISGHRLGTAEVESALISHESVAEAAAIAVPDELKGESLHLFVVLRPDFQASDELTGELGQHIKTEIGRFLQFDKITYVSRLPKTRSGKIMRRVLRAQVLGLDPGDISTQED